VVYCPPKANGILDVVD